MRVERALSVKLSHNWRRGAAAFGNGKVIAAVVKGGARFSFVLTESQPVLRAIVTIAEVDYTAFAGTRSPTTCCAPPGPTNNPTHGSRVRLHICQNERTLSLSPRMGVRTT